MRGSRTPRKVIASNFRNRRVAFRRKYHSPRSVWIVNDNGLPKSPLSIERLPGGTKRSISRVARVKPTCREMVRKRGRTPEDPFLFFIDKSRSEELADVRPSHMNESIVLLESPTVSTSTTEVPCDRRRQESVDTVDLCSDGEEGNNTTTNNRTKRKRLEGVSGEKRRKLCLKAQADQQPDVIVLDDEDEDADQSCENNTSVIVDLVQIKTSNNERCSDNPPSTSSASGSRKTRSVAPYSGRDSKFRSKYLDKSQTVSMPHEKGVEVSRNTNPSRAGQIAESSSTIPDILDAVGSNVFNPCGNVEQTGLRPIIIDGCNVAIAHGGNRMFSVRGLCICVEYFLRRGHNKVVAVVPLHQRSKVSPHDRDVLEALKDDGHLVFTPSRYIDNRLISSYDDRYIVQYAVAVGGVIVSRDNYRDLLTENPAWRDTITNRLLMPTWVGDILMFPMDPLGKSGPSLDDFLQFPRK